MLHIDFDQPYVYILLFLSHSMEQKERNPIQKGKPIEAIEMNHNSEK